MITEPVVPTQAPHTTTSVSRRQVAVIAAVAVLAAAIGLVLGLSVMAGPWFVTGPGRRATFRPAP